MSLGDSSDSKIVFTVKCFGSSVKCIDRKLNKGLLLTWYDFPGSMV